MSVPQYKNQIYDVDMSQSLIGAMNDNIELYDETLNEIYGYNSVNNLGLINDTYNRSYFSEKYGTGPIGDNLLSMINENKNMQHQLKEIISKESDSIEKSIQKSVDAQQNQKIMNQYVEAEKNTLESATNQISDDIYNDKRQIEINNYYYKKNKAQINILYMFIVLCIVLYVLNIMQKQLGEYVNDSIISITSGLLIALFIIYLFYALYDILLRDDIIFDEYLNNWSGKTGLSIGNKSLYDNSDEDKECKERPSEEEEST